MVCVYNGSNLKGYSLVNPNQTIWWTAFNLTNNTTKKIIATKINSVYPSIECVHVASQEGDYSYKKAANTDDSSSDVCGLYIVADPDKTVEISIKYLDAPCDTGALLAVIFFLIPTLIIYLFEFLDQMLKTSKYSIAI